MRRVRWLLGTLMIVGASACGTSVSPNLVQVTGTVRHYAFEGGFWAVRGDDSTTYDPVSGLPAAFQQEGLRVRLQAKLRNDLVGTHAVGPIVDIVTIQRL